MGRGVEYAHRFPVCRRMRQRKFHSRTRERGSLKANLTLVVIPVIDILVKWCWNCLDSCWNIFRKVSVYDDVSSSSLSRTREKLLSFQGQPYSRCNQEFKTNHLYPRELNYFLRYFDNNNLLSSSECFWKGVNWRAYRCLVWTSCFHE